MLALLFTSRLHIYSQCKLSPLWKSFISSSREKSRVKVYCRCYSMPLFRRWPEKLYSTLQMSSALIYCNALAKVKVTLRLTTIVSLSCVESYLGLMTSFQFSLINYPFVFMRRPLYRQDGPAPCQMSWSIINVHNMYNFTCVHYTEWFFFQLDAFTALRFTGTGAPLPAGRTISMPKIFRMKGSSYLCS
jgi:hypothetical protein